MGTEQPRAQPPGGTFRGWIRDLHRRGRVALATLYIIPIATLLGSLFQHQAVRFSSLSVDQLRLILYAVQAAVVLVLSFTIPKVWPSPEVLARLKREGADMVRVGERAQEFASLWTNGWFCWFLLYSCMAILGLHTFFAGGQAPWYSAPAQNLLNNVQTVFFFLAFRELRFPTYGKSSPQFRWIAIVLTIAGIEALLLSAPDPVAKTWGVGVSEVVGWCTGFVAGTAIALLVGRLETKLINTSVLLSGALYFYAAIQGAFFVFLENPKLALILTSLAFVLKVVLYTFIAWLLGSGMLCFYLSQMQGLDAIVPGNKEQFFADVRREHSE